MQHQHAGRARVMVVIFALITLSVAPGSTANAYSYPGIKWPRNYVKFEVNLPGWSTTPVSGARDAWNYAGSTFIFFVQSWSSTRGYGRDGVNAVSKADRGTINPLAQASRWWDGTTMLEADIQFNTSYPWAFNGENWGYDVQSAATHELGHWLILNHSSHWCGWPWQATMCPAVGKGDTSFRSLTGDDKNGIKAIYPI